MRALVASLITLSLLAAPAQVSAASFDTYNVRPGTFVGARLRLPLGQQASAKPRAELALAPTHSRVSNSGFVRTRIGEGVALGITSGSGPTMTLAGTRADIALGLRPGRKSVPGNRQQLSTGGWVAVGVGVTVVAAAVAFVLFKDAVDDASD